MESVSFAFLLALEVLSPLQRAVLLLRDVFDYSVRETAEALAVSEANTKTTHLRARRAMAVYESDRQPLTVERRAQTGAALERFLRCVAAGDVPGVEAMLADDARALTDGGGEYHAARVPVIGRARVAAFFIGVTQRVGPLVRFDVRILNGLPAFVGEQDARPGWAPRVVIEGELDDQGRFKQLYTVLASRKLTAVR